jgi:AbrB family looped-hinge helix DNA binding protein
MIDKLTIDKAGRIVLPKPIRDQLQLQPGDALQMETSAESITLRPVRQHASMRKELGIWVFEEERRSVDSIPDLIDIDRERRNRSLSE